MAAQAAAMSSGRDMSAAALPVRPCVDRLRQPRRAVGPCYMASFDAQAATRGQRIATGSARDHGGAVVCTREH